MAEIEKVIDGLEQLKFFNQRGGRELWNNKPTSVQNEDINNAEKRLEEAIQTIREFQEQNGSFQKTINALMGQIQEMEVQIPKWHLVADGDLPTTEQYITNNGLFIVSDGNRVYSEWFDIYDNKLFGEPTIERFRVDRCVIAWMELPKFEGGGINAI